MKTIRYCNFYTKIIQKGNNDPETYDKFDGTIYDTLPRNEIEKSLGEKLIKFNQNMEVNFKIGKLQIQKNNVCGYFACAIATALCFGLDPETIEFDEHEMKEHFINILYKKKKMSMFPFSKVNRKSTSDDKILNYKHIEN